MVQIRSGKGTLQNRREANTSDMPLRVNKIALKEKTGNIGVRGTQRQHLAVRRGDDDGRQRTVAAVERQIHYKFRQLAAVDNRNR